MPGQACISRSKVVVVLEEITVSWSTPLTYVLVRRFGLSARRRAQHRHVYPGLEYGRSLTLVRAVGMA